MWHLQTEAHTRRTLSTSRISAAARRFRSTHSSDTGNAFNAGTANSNAPPANRQRNLVATTEKHTSSSLTATSADIMPPATAVSRTVRDKWDHLDVNDLKKVCHHFNQPTHGNRKQTLVSRLETIQAPVPTKLEAMRLVEPRTPNTVNVEHEKRIRREQAAQNPWLTTAASMGLNDDLTDGPYGDDTEGGGGGGGSGGGRPQHAFIGEDGGEAAMSAMTQDREARDARDRAAAAMATTTPMARDGDDGALRRVQRMSTTTGAGGLRAAGMPSDPFTDVSASSSQSLFYGSDRAQNYARTMHYHSSVPFAHTTLPRPHPNLHESAPGGDHGSAGAGRSQRPYDTGRVAGGTGGEPGFDHSTPMTEYDERCLEVFGAAGDMSLDGGSNHNNAAAGGGGNSYAARRARAERTVEATSAAQAMNMREANRVRDERRFRGNDHASRGTSINHPVGDVDLDVAALTLEERRRAKEYAYATGRVLVPDHLTRRHRDRHRARLGHGNRHPPSSSMTEQQQSYQARWPLLDPAVAERVRVQNRILNNEMDCYYTALDAGDGGVYECVEGGVGGGGVRSSYASEYADRYDGSIRYHRRRHAHAMDRATLDAHFNRVNDDDVAAALTGGVTLHPRMQTAQIASEQLPRGVVGGRRRDVVYGDEMMTSDDYDDGVLGRDGYAGYYRVDGSGAPRGGDVGMGASFERARDLEPVTTRPRTRVFDDTGLRPLAQSTHSPTLTHTHNMSPSRRRSRSRSHGRQRRPASASSAARRRRSRSTSRARSSTGSAAGAANAKAVKALQRRGRDDLALLRRRRRDGEDDDDGCVLMYGDVDDDFGTADVHGRMSRVPGTGRYSHGYRSGGGRSNGFGDVYGDSFGYVSERVPSRAVDRALVADQGRRTTKKKTTPAFARPTSASAMRAAHVYAEQQQRGIGGSRRSSGGPDAVGHSGGGQRNANDAYAAALQSNGNMMLNPDSSNSHTQHYDDGDGRTFAHATTAARAAAMKRARTRNGHVLSTQTLSSSEYARRRAQALERERRHERRYIAGQPGCDSNPRVHVANEWEVGLLVANRRNTHGVVVTDVVRGSPGHVAGIKAGDLITHVNGVPVARLKAYHVAISGNNPEDIEFQVQREGCGQRIMSVKQTPVQAR